MNAGERRAFWHYRLRGYRILGTNVRAGRNELDLIVRRGRSLTFVEVKQRRSGDFGGALGAVDTEKRVRVRNAARVWLSRNPQRPGVLIGFEVVAVEGRRLERREITIGDG
jgi:putative endonuclease